MSYKAVSTERCAQTLGPQYVIILVRISTPAADIPSHSDGKVGPEGAAGCAAFLMRIYWYRWQHLQAIEGCVHILLDSHAYH